MRETISKRTRFEVLRRDQFKCRYCGTSANDRELHIDHVVPVASGGSSAIDNLAASCVACNFGKGFATLEQSALDHSARTRAAVAEARATGKKLGRPFKRGPLASDVVWLRWQGLSWTEVAVRLDCTVAMARRRALLGGA